MAKSQETIPSTSHQHHRDDDTQYMNRPAASMINPNNESVPSFMQLETLLGHMDTCMHIKDVTDPKIILVKMLTPAHFSDEQARLTIPADQILDVFLTGEEYLYLQKKDSMNNYTTIEVKVIMGYVMYDLRLSRVDVQTNNNVPGYSYMLTNGWGQVREDNRLKRGVTIRLVSFRSKANNQLHIAIQENQDLGLLIYDNPHRWVPYW